jgi:hypothetical protein
MKKNDKDYIVIFKGAKLNKRQANQVGLALICGFLAAIVVVPTIGKENPIISKAIVVLFAMAAFFASRALKKK